MDSLSESPVLFSLSAYRRYKRDGQVSTGLDSVRPGQVRNLVSDEPGTKHGIFGALQPGDTSKFMIS